MQHQVPAFSINLNFNRLPPDEIATDYALHDLEVLTLLIISCTTDAYCYLQERVLLVAIDAWAEAGLFRETFDEQVQEGLQVRV